jgi:hypothetical protein
MGALLSVILISLNEPLTEQQSLFFGKTGVRKHEDVLVQLINAKRAPITCKRDSARHYKYDQAFPRKQAIFGDLQVQVHAQLKPLTNQNEILRD